MLRSKTCKSFKMRLFFLISFISPFSLWEKKKGKLFSDVVKLKEREGRCGSVGGTIVVVSEGFVSGLVNSQI